MHRHAIIAGAIGVILLVSVCASAGAQDNAFDYNRHPQVFKVCELFIPPLPPPAPAFVPPGPNTGPIVDLVAPGSLLPRGWVLANPLRHPNSLLNPPTASGWFAMLDPGALAHLSEYDLVLLSTANVALLLAHPNKHGLLDTLKAMCDAGVVVWIDGSAGAADFVLPANESPLVGFGSSAGGGPAMVDTTHPIATTPFSLTVNDLTALCGAGQSVALLADSTHYVHPVVGGLGAPSIAAGQYGSGAVVVSATNVFGGLATPLVVPPPPLTPADVLANFRKQAGQKLTCNILAWSQRWSTEAAVPRHLGYVNFTVQPPLSMAWQFPSALGGATIPATYGPCIVDRGIAFGISSDGTAFALDLNPARDLDGNGASDDGLSDYSVGLPYDALWATGTPPVPPLLPVPVTAGFVAPCAAVATLWAAGTPALVEQVVVFSVLVPGGGAAVTCLRARDGMPWPGWPGPHTPVSSNPIIWISSPVIHQGFVYFLTQEEGPVAGAEQYYTRVHAIDLDTGGATSSWVYPDPTVELGPGGVPVNALIPPVISPADIATYPGPAPCISTTARAADGRLLDAVVRFGTIGSFASDSVPGDAVFVGGILDGGSEFAIVPTPPANGVITRPPNARYYRVRVSASQTATFDPDGDGTDNVWQDDGVTPAVAPVPTPSGFPAPPPPWPGPYEALGFNQAWARAYLLNEANLPAGATSSDPVGWQEGRNISVEYDSPGPDGNPGTPDDVAVTETVLLHGPVLWKRRFGIPPPPPGSPAPPAGPPAPLPQPRVASSTVDGGTVLGATLYSNYDPLAGARAVLYGLGAENKDRILGFMPSLFPQAALPPGGVTWAGTPAASGATAYLLESSATSAALTAFDMHPDLSIRIRGVSSIDADLDGVPDLWIVPGSVTIDFMDGTLAPAAASTLDPRAYTVDSQTHVITFDPTFSSLLPPGTAGRLGDYWDVSGKRVGIRCRHDGGPPRRDGQTIVPLELHVVPDVRRYQTTTGLIKLRYPPADVDVDGSGTVDEDDVFIYPAAIALPTAPRIDAKGVDGTLDTADDEYDVDANGVIRFNPSLSWLGREVEVHYVGDSEYDEGSLYCGSAVDPNAVLPPERHYVPDDVPQSRSSPTVTGGAFHTGVHLSAPGTQRGTVWSGAWDKSGTAVRTAFSSPAAGYDDPADPTDDHAVSGAPAAATIPLEPIDMERTMGSTIYSFLPDDGPDGQPGTRDDLQPRLEFLLHQNSLPIAASFALDGAVGPPDVRNALVVATSTAPLPGDPALGLVSALLPPRTLIADSTRLVEANGADVDWETIASSSNLAGQSYTSLRSLDRVAKVKVLDPHHNIRVLAAGGFPLVPDPGTGVDIRTGMEVTASHLLVVDTGNNRVVEIDRQGNVVWPVEARRSGGGWIFEEVDLGLKEPSDAYRWVALEEDPNGNGAVDPGEEQYDFNSNGQLDLVYHTLIADTGNARVVDFKTYVHVYPTNDAFSAPPLRPPFEPVALEHQSNYPTPTNLDVFGDPVGPDPWAVPIESLGRVEYSHAVPIFDPQPDPGNPSQRGRYIGILCAARNLHRLIVIDTTVDPASANPRMRKPRPFPRADQTPLGSTTAWAWLAWLHDSDLDLRNDDPLYFESIKDLRLLPEPHGISAVDADDDGTVELYPANGRGYWPEGGILYLTITCAGYRNPPIKDLDGDGTNDVPAHEPICLEFAVDISDPTAADYPDFLAFDGSAAGLPKGTPHWIFRRQDYIRAGSTPGADGALGTPDDEHPYTTLRDRGADGVAWNGDDNTLSKPWVPTSCQRLEDGSHIIANAPAQPANVTAANFPGQDTNFGEIIHVLTNYALPAPPAPFPDPYLDDPRRYRFGRWELIPEPNAAPWTERLSQPAYVQRY